jgi:hypothetical protein
MKKSQMIKDVLSLIAKESANESKRYGVHYYEHDNGTYRTCPEAFIVHSVLNKLKMAGYGVTAEAHQGGIWKLAGKENAAPEGTHRYRYDLAIWKSAGTPIMLCEFKWHFGSSDFHEDAENLAVAQKELGATPVVVLLAVKPSKDDLGKILTDEEQFMEGKYGLLSKERSQVKSTARYFCGRAKENEFSYTQVSAMALKL